MERNATRIVLVTGASRGIGADVAREFASDDTHVVVHCRTETDGAEAVAENIRSAGGQASTITADISDEASVTAMLDEIDGRFGRIDVLVLNASSRTEPGTEVGYAMRRNREAQRRLARLALPLMPVGGHIIFVTSHQAHFYPAKAVPKGYALIAASKHAGETTLYAMRSEFDRRGVHFTVVSGDVRDEEDCLRFGSRRGPSMMAHPTRAPRPSSNDIAVAITRAAHAPNPSGVVYVHGTEQLVSA
jgi:3-oxoacyl-[acyl-carrier protein] reductase